MTIVGRGTGISTTCRCVIRHGNVPVTFGVSAVIQLYLLRSYFRVLEVKYHLRSCLDVYGLRAFCWLFVGVGTAKLKNERKHTFENLNISKEIESLDLFAKCFFDLVLGFFFASSLRSKNKGRTRGFNYRVRSWYGQVKYVSKLWGFLDISRILQFSGTFVVCLLFSWKLSFPTAPSIQLPSENIYVLLVGKAGRLWPTVAKNQEIYVC